MTTYYIDPDHTGSDAGTLANPWTSWASAAKNGAGNVYLQKRGTTHIGGFITQGSGQPGNPVRFGAYYNADGSDDPSKPKPRLDTTTTADNGIIGNGKSWMVVEDFEIFGGTKSGVIFYCTAVAAAEGVRIRRCVAHDVGGVGVAINPLPGYDYLAMPDAIIEDCVAYNTGSHGITMTGALTSGTIIRNCEAWNNGLTQNSWGVYMSGRSYKVKTSPGAWIQVGATDAWELDVNAETPLITGEIIRRVVASGRTDPDAQYHLDQGTWDALGPDEWAKQDSPLACQVNLGGESPNNISVPIQTGDAVGCIMENCIAHDQAFNIDADGLGLGFDHVVENGIIRNCISYGNSGGGISNNANLSGTIHNCLAYNNGKEGIKVNTTSQLEADKCKVYNNTVFNNVLSGLYCTRAPKVEFKNNITFNNGRGLEIDSNSTGADYDYQCNYNNTVYGDVGANDITTDPLLDDNQFPRLGSPCIGTGETLLSNFDAYSRPNTAPGFHIGAVWPMVTTNKIRRKL